MQRSSPKYNLYFYFFFSYWLVYKSSRLNSNEILLNCSRVEHQSKTPNETNGELY